MLCPVCNRSLLELRSNTTPQLPGSTSSSRLESFSSADDAEDGDESFRSLFKAVIPSEIELEGAVGSSPTWTVDARQSDCALRIAVQDDDDLDFQTAGAVNDDDDFPTIISIPIVLGSSALGPSSSLSALLFQADTELLADPALLAQAKRSRDWSVVQLSHVIAQLVVHFQKRVCHHGVLLNHRVLVTLVQDTDVEGCCGLYNIIDMFGIIDHDRVQKLGIVDEELFEVAAEEYAMSAPTFLQLTSWETYHCQSGSGIRERKKWAHVLFLSHRWQERGVPGDVNELQILQQAVRSYIEVALQRGTTTTVKNFTTAYDFGVWLDYMMVPNDVNHADCETCRTHRHICVAKMAAIPTIATTIALHPDERSRGWILHELTMNTHQNIQDVRAKSVDITCPHGARINIMVPQRVHFTNGSDGSALRCSEFLRLGQLPRNWPSVTKQLLQEWKEAGVQDERDAGPAKHILFQYARTFHFPCQKLKRAMIVWPQLLARRGIAKSDLNDWVYVSYKDRPRPTGATAIPFLDRDRKEADEFDWSPNAIFNLNVVEQEIRNQEEAIKSLGINNDLASATSTLQRMQFVAMTMGLRAELMFGEGWLHWVHLSALTESLTSCKRAVRWYNGVAIVQPTSCSVSFRRVAPNPKTVSTVRLGTISSLTRDTTKLGVSADQLRWALDCLVPVLDPVQPLENNLSGYAPTWFDAAATTEDEDDGL
jgi:hypothetical protein